jgi:prevent-host-death family protein
MEEVAARAAREQWSSLLDQVEWRDREFVITRNGKPVAKLVPVASPADGDTRMEDT